MSNLDYNPDKQDHFTGVCFSPGLLTRQHLRPALSFKAKALRTNFGDYHQQNTIILNIEMAGSYFSVWLPNYISHTLFLFNKHHKHFRKKALVNQGLSIQGQGQDQGLNFRGQGQALTTLDLPLTALHTLYWVCSCVHLVPPAVLALCFGLLLLLYETWWNDFTHKASHRNEAYLQ